MIIKAKHHFFIYPFFQHYTLRQLRKKFHSVKIIGEFDEKKQPVLIIANHMSWWDGFFLMYLNLKRLHRKFHFMMLEEQLRKHWYFNYAGGYSVRKNSKIIFKTLKYTAELLEDKNNMIFIFPQGEIRSMHEQTLTFESGVERIIQYCNNDVHILFVANLIEYFSNPKPTLFIHIQTYDGTDYTTKYLQNAYNNFYKKAIDYQINEEVR